MLLEAFFELLFEFATSLTGYAVMFVFSLGRVRPKPEDDLLATIVGLTFWAIVIGALCFWYRE